MSCQLDKSSVAVDWVKAELLLLSKSSAFFFIASPPTLDPLASLYKILRKISTVGWALDPLVSRKNLGKVLVWKTLAKISSVS